MQGSYKQFSQRLYDENDEKARNAVRRYLGRVVGLFVKDNKDHYGPDLVVYKGLKHRSYVEVEVKRGWVGDVFPWDSIQLPERKEKFLLLKKPIQFWILNSTLEYAVIIPGTEVTQVPLVEIRNIHIGSGEMFRQIPIEKCTIIRLGEY